MAFAPKPEPHKPNPPLKSSRPERRGISRRTVIQEAKERVSVVELAERLGVHLRPSGKDLRGPCPVHGGKNPTSFAVDPEQGVWFCYSCLIGGDVVELTRHAWNYSKADVAMAAADLLHEFDHEVPPRPASWFRRQERQKPIRAAIDEAKVRHLRRRVFCIFMPLIEEMADEAEKCEETEHLWGAAEEIAVLVVAGRAA